MPLRIKAVMLALTLFILPVSYRPSRPNAGVVGTGTPASCTEAALINAMTGGGTVTFNCGASGATILFSSVISVTQDTTIDGGNTITLSGGLASGLFHDLGVVFTLDNIVLDKADNTTSEGSAVVGSGTLTLNNVKIQNSVNGGCGGAIWMLGKVNITNSLFFNNNAANGGAICTGDTQATELKIVDTTFTGNTATLGGAIYLTSPTILWITRGFFGNNTAQAGGALYESVNSNVIINGDQFPSFFQSNNAQLGGAIDNLGGTLNISDSTFYQNQVVQNVVLDGYGGAILDQGVLTMNNVQFDSNLGRFGAGVCVCGAPNAITATISNSTFHANQASENGGGLYANSDTETVNVSDTAFSDNSAIFGGGIARFQAVMTITDSSFTQNSATQGGGLGNSSAPSPTIGGYLELSSSSFILNTSVGGKGGGIVNSAEIDLVNVSMVANANGVYNAGAGTIMRMTNTLLSNAGSLNCDGDGTLPTSAGGNFAIDTSCGLTGPGDQQGTNLDPKLFENLTLDKRSGTYYYPVLNNSPLIDAGVAGCPVTDQRSANRIDTCDIGAIDPQGLLPGAYLAFIGR